MSDGTFFLSHGGRVLPEIWGGVGVEDHRARVDAIVRGGVAASGCGASAVASSD